MSKKALIHIGTFKTGSTSIQAALSSAAMQGALGDITYPELDPIFAKCQHYLDTFYRHESSRFPHFIYLAKKSDIDLSVLYRSYLDKLKSADGIILSSELMSNFGEDEIQSLKRDLDANGYTDYKIVIYIRELVSHYISILQEYMKSSRNCFQPSWHNYFAYVRTAVERFCEAFGGRVFVREFDRNKLVGNDVVTDFSEMAAEFFDVGIRLEPTRENEALSAEAAFILHEHRRSAPFSSADEQILFPETQSLIQQLLNCGPETTKISLHPWVADFIASQNSDDAVWFREKYDIDFSYPAKAISEIALKEPLKLDEIIVKPSGANLESVRKRVKIPAVLSPDPAFRPPNRESRLIDFLYNEKYKSKVLFGGGSVFLDMVGKMWVPDSPIKFSGVNLVDKNPRVEKIKEFTLVFVTPEDIHWQSVDAVLICAPAYDEEIRRYLLGKNSWLSISSIDRLVEERPIP